MLITTYQNESPKKSMAKAISKAIPSQRIDVYFDSIEIGKWTLEASKDLRDWLYGDGAEPIQIKLDRATMTAYPVNDPKDYLFECFVDDKPRGKKTVNAKNAIEAIKSYMPHISWTDTWWQVTGNQVKINIDGHCAITAEPA